MARKTNTDPFDFRNARGSSGRTAFRTPMMGGISREDQRRYAEWNKAREWGYVDSEGRMFSEAGVSPYKAIAMFFAKLARAGVGEADKFSALSSVAAKAPRSPVALRALGHNAKLGLKEAEALLTDMRLKNPVGYSSKMFPDGIRNLFRPGEIEAIYNSFGKLEGRLASRMLADRTNIIRNMGQGPFRVMVDNAMTAGRVLKGRKLK